MNRNLVELNCTDVIVRCSEHTVQEIINEMITYFYNMIPKVWHSTTSVPWPPLRNGTSQTKKNVCRNELVNESETLSLIP